MPFATIPSPESNALEFGPLTIHYYGLAIALGAILAVWLLRRRYAAMGGDPDFADRAAVWGLIAGVIGARLGFATTHFGAFADRPWEILFVWQGGLVFFGGLLVGSIVLLAFVRRHIGSVAMFTDAAAPAIPLAHAVGRWGNYFNQELYGSATGLPWGLEIAREPVPVHPTFLYESLANLALAGGLVLLGRTGRVARGGLIFSYLVGYGVIRFLVELLRVDTEFRLLNLSRNNYAALFILLLGLAGLWWNARRAPAPAPEPEAESSAPASQEPAASAAPSEPSGAAESQPSHGEYSWYEAGD